MLAPPGVVDRAVVYTYYNSAIRWHGTATVAAGAQSATSIDVDANLSSTVYIRGWASGAAGSKISYQILRWPKNGQADIEGWSEHRGLADHYYGLWTSPGLNVTRTFIVPKTAPAGYPYEIHVTDDATSPATEDGLDIYDAFQVCSLHTSAWTIRRGHSILLSGLVPTSTAARMGEHPGPVKTLLVFARTTAAGQPSDWLAKGWTKVATVKSGGTGYFKTKALRPTQTTWYVVRYPQDGWDWRAFTSVIKVTVK